MNNIFVYIENEGGKVADVCLELLTKGRELATTLGVKLEAVVLGEHLAGIETELAKYGADTVWVADDKIFAPFRTLPHTAVMCGLIEQEKPQIALFGATCNGRDFAPRVSSALYSGLTADCTQLVIGDHKDAKTGKEYKDLLYQIRPAFGGNIIATIVNPDNRPQMATVREGVMRREYAATPGAGEVKKIDWQKFVKDTDLAVRILDREISESKIDIKKLQLSISQLEKGGYPHFMLKEIFEQPKTIVDCIRGRINPETYDVILSGIMDNRERFLNARRIIFVACGTSWHASLIGEYLIEDFCRIPVEVEYASEFRYRNPVIYPDDIVIAVSQSGETADTLAAIELAKQNGAFVYGICNVIGSSIARATDSGTYIHVGPEIGVASTKAFTGQVTVLTMLALMIARVKGTIDQECSRKIAKHLLDLPAVLEEVLRLNDRIADFSKIFTYAHNFIYLGRGYNYPTALEGALKLKEISYIHAEGYPAAEMKHGPIALIDAEMPTIAIATPDHTYEKTASNIEEIKARGGKVITVIAKGDEQVRKSSDYFIEVPVVAECLMPIVVSVPLQLLAYHIAVNKGRDVDQPRNLAKSVTVE